jgi:carbamoyl-phosphate synthase small subunit
LTYPHIGNTGVNSEDVESGQVYASGLIIRDLPLTHSNWRSEQSLSEYLVANNVVAIADIDTRKLTRILREKGAQAGCIIAGAANNETSAEAEALAQAKAFPGLSGMDLAKVVSVNASYEFAEGEWDLASGYAKPSNPAFHVVAFDYGVKRNILRMLTSRGCKVTVLQAQATAEQALALKPDGVFLSNGPGDPQPCDYAISAIKAIVDKGVPTFGICLGHQLLALASGCWTSVTFFSKIGATKYSGHC